MPFDLASLLQQRLQGTAQQLPMSPGPGRTPAPMMSPAPQTAPQSFPVMGPQPPNIGSGTATPTDIGGAGKPPSAGAPGMDIGAIMSLMSSLAPQQQAMPQQQLIQPNVQRPQQSLGDLMFQQTNGGGR